jgi:hypothetical protein
MSVVSLTGIRLGQLVLDLGSKHPEHAAAEICRLLAADGRDLEYLAGLVVTGYGLAVVEDDESWVRAGMEILRVEGLAPHEMSFVYDMVCRFRAGGYEATEKQMNWFVAIYRKYVDQAKAS